MNRTAPVVLLLVAISLPSAARSAEGSLVLPVWPGQTVGDSGKIGPERVRKPEEAPTKNAKWITNVTKPTISVFRPAKEKNVGAAVVICPGGGYWNLAWDLEGEEVAAWLNSLGVTGVVLKYRVPRRPGKPEREPAPGPLLDAQRAISLVRSRAAEWGIDPGRIGIVGFSAGGHLAVATATSFDRRGYEPIDEVDKVSCRPDFAVAVYPGYFIEQRPAGKEINRHTLAPYIRIPPKTPPVFLAHASDDKVAGAENCTVLYDALKKAGVSAEVHVYARGGHGFGVRKSREPCSTWTDRCADWLGALGVLEAGADQVNAKLTRALTLHASFDAGLDADFSRGDKACFVAGGKELKRAAVTGEVRVAPAAGRFGGALHFSKKSAFRPAYKGEGVLGYNDRSWSATVSVWLRLDPDKDLEPGYCDPVQIVGDDVKKGFIFLEWSKDETPRHFRYAIRPLFPIWNPKNVPWDAIPAGNRPMVQVARAPFSSTDWTHVVFTLENINDKSNRPLGRLYLNGKLQGAIENWDLRFGWDPARVLLVLGAAYVGHMDDLAVFGRALTDAEVRRLHGLKGGARELAAEASRPTKP